MTLQEIEEMTQQALKEFPSAQIVDMSESTYQKVKASKYYKAATPFETFCGLIIRVLPDYNEDKIYIIP